MWLGFEEIAEAAAHQPHLYGIWAMTLCEKGGQPKQFCVDEWTL
jgi:hypothetical protein